MTRTSVICHGAEYHSPMVLEIDYHHIYPTYLCALLDVPKRTETVALCAGCHDRVHHFIRHIVNDGSLTGHRPTDGERLLLDAFWTWWISLLG